MSATVGSQALTELLGRAGASDQDKTAWLAERAHGITATEVRDLRIGKIRQQDLIDLKLGRKTDTFTGNEYTSWGKAREQVIANAFRGVGIEPETRVFHSAVDSRYLASPDGIGVDFDDEIVVSEIKTSGKDIHPGTAAYDRTGYAVQMQWVMWVTGAGRCRYIVEQRLRAVSGGFIPGELSSEWVERDDALITELVDLADGFLAELDRQRVEGRPNTDEVAAGLLRADLEAQAAAKTARAALEEYVASAGLSALRIPEGSLSYSTPSPRASFQSAAFKAAHPDMYAEFTELVPASKPTLRVTAARKGMNE